MLFTTANKSLLALAPRLAPAAAALRVANNNSHHVHYRCMASLAHKRFQKRKQLTPDRELALAMPTSVKEMDNSSLITLAAMNDHEAACEMLIRHIMSHDKVNYASALEKFDEIEEHHGKGLTLYLIPYNIGIATAVSAACISVPLVFHLPTVHWFNHFFVTADIPPPQDLETWLEVGSWSWNWMEPPLGQISFFLLCLQFSRCVITIIHCIV